MKNFVSIIVFLIVGTMNLSAQVTDSVFAAQFMKKTFTDTNGTILPYRFLTPPCNGGSAEYPVVLFLHGAGERGNDNEINLNYIDKVFAAEKFRSEHPCYVIVPQCAEKYRWCEVEWTADYHTMPAQISKYLGAAVQLLDSVIGLKDADPKRVYVTGMSMGGFGTWDLISRFPNKFAAAMPICGGADEKMASKLTKIPIRTFHGATDKLVKVSRSRNIYKAIKSQGGNNIEYTEFPSMGHLIWDKVYSNYDNIEWLFSNTKK